MPCSTSWQRRVSLLSEEMLQSVVAQRRVVIVSATLVRFDWHVRQISSTAPSAPASWSWARASGSKLSDASAAQQPPTRAPLHASTHSPAKPPVKPWRSVSSCVWRINTRATSVMGLHMPPSVKASRTDRENAMFASAVAQLAWTLRMPLLSIFVSAFRAPSSTSRFSADGDTATVRLQSAWDTQPSTRSSSGSSASSRPRMTFFRSPAATSSDPWTAMATSRHSGRSTMALPTPTSTTMRSACSPSVM